MKKCLNIFTIIFLIVLFVLGINTFFVSQFNNDENSISSYSNVCITPKGKTVATNEVEFLVETFEFVEIHAHSMKFKIDVKSGDGTNYDVFDTSRLDLYSFDSPIGETTYISNESTSDSLINTYFYEVNGLNENNQYHDLDLYYLGEKISPSLPSEISGEGFKTLKEIEFLVSPNYQPEEIGYNDFEFTMGVKYGIGNDSKYDDFNPYVDEISIVAEDNHNKPILLDDVEYIPSNTTIKSETTNYYKYRVNGLESGQVYKNLKVESDKISESFELPFDIITLSPMQMEANTFEVTKIKKKSFNFNISVNNIYEWNDSTHYVRFDPDNTILTSGEEELEVKPIEHKDSTSNKRIYYYSVENLKSHTIYDNLELTMSYSIGLDDYESIVNLSSYGPITTKLNWLAISATSILILVLITIGLALFLYIENKKIRMKKLITTPNGNVIVLLNKDYEEYGHYIHSLSLVDEFHKKIEFDILNYSHNYGDHSSNINSFLTKYNGKIILELKDLIPKNNYRHLIFVDYNFNEWKKIIGNISV